MILCYNQNNSIIHGGSTMDYVKKYDEKDPKSIEKYAKKLIGHTFKEVLLWNADKTSEKKMSYGDSARKGGLGNLLEEKYFGYDANSTSEADFQKAGVELKVSPYEIKRNGELKAGERLVLGMISYEKPIEETLLESHIWDKCNLLLLIYYLREKEVKDNLQYRIDFVKLFTPPEEDLEIMKNDFKIISDKIRSGKAHELSESDTMYLGACTKGATAAKSLATQFYNKDVKAKKRAFCFKNSYMTYVLNNYLVPDKTTYGETIVSSDELKHKSFAEILQDKLSKYVGMYEDDIAHEINVTMNKRNKSYEATLIYNMLGVKNNRIEEFEKAGILVKVLKYRKQKSDNQQFRLEDINFIELNNEKMDDEIIDEEGNPIGWEYSALYNMLSNRKYLFAIFWEDERGSVFKGCQLWGMPDNDIEIVRGVWTRTKNIIKSGVEFTFNKRVENNLPGIADNGIFHIRPHAQRAYYEFLDGTKVGNGSVSDSDLLPDGTRMTKQAYWLNRDYIDKQIVSNLRKEY